MEVVTGPDSVRDQTLWRLVDQYQTTLLRMCFLYLQDEEQAKDAVQETFLKAYKAANTFRRECSEKTWLMRIAMNTCQDMRRSAWYRYVDRRIAVDALPQTATVEPPEEDVQLTRSVMRLPHKLKEVVLLYYYQDLTMTEIAETLGIAQSTVSMRLKRARSKLRTTLEGGHDHG